MIPEVFVDERVLDDEEMLRRSEIALRHIGGVGALVHEHVIDGVLVELGTHEELLRQGGTYARLYAMQFDLGEEVATS